MTHSPPDSVARLWDLEAAYRQLARTPSHGSLTVIAVWSPEGRRILYFAQPTLAFGAAASVLSFNWVAVALREVLIVLFIICATKFYDDFTIVEVEALATSATAGRPNAEQ